MKVCNEIRAGVTIWFLFASAMSAMRSMGVICNHGNVL